MNNAIKQNDQEFVITTSTNCELRIVPLAVNGQNSKDGLFEMTWGEQRLAMHLTWRDIRTLREWLRDQRMDY